MAIRTILTPFQTEVLNEVAKNPTFIKQFYLTGGTALAEFHLHHRLSEDLDFFSEEEFSPYTVQAFVKKLVKLLKLTNTEYRVQGSLHIFILHRGNDKLKIDFNYYPFPRVDKKLHYQKLEVDGMHDIAINKLQTIATTPRTRDFIDLYCIIQKSGIELHFLSDRNVSYERTPQISLNRKPSPFPVTPYPLRSATPNIFTTNIPQSN